MRKFLTIESSTHMLIALFTLTSWANIKAFLVGAGHDWLAAALLSGALGAALAVISLALTKIDLATERPTLLALVSVGAGLALLSGALQASEYSRHLSTLWAIALGFGTPVLGEIGLSLASALFSKAQRRADLRAVNAKIEAAIVGNLEAAIAGFDPTTIQRRIDRTLNRVALAAVGGVEANLMAVYGAPLAEPVEPSGNLSPASTDISPNVPPISGDLTLANTIRTDKMSTRIAETLTLIQTGQYSLDAIADTVGVNPKTITRYIDRLRISGHNVSVNGVVKLA